MYDYVERRESSEPSGPPGPPGPRSDATGSIVVREVRWRRVGSWLASGAGDLVGCRGRSLLFGLCYVGMGHAIWRAHDHHVSWFPGFAAAFLFLGPLLAVGTYELSRQRERGDPPDLLVAAFAWSRNPRGLCLHAALLCVVLTLWLQVSWGSTTPSSPGTGLGTLSVDATALLSSVSRWTLWIALSAAAFAASVVAVPMLLDRTVGVLRAIRTSVLCCVTSPAAMGVWALSVAALIGASLWLDFWPLAVTGPWVGHATWHVYRDCVARAVVEPVPAER